MMILGPSVVILLAAGFLQTALAVLPGVVEAAHQLTADNWKEKTQNGLWLVEHFSPGCGHCRAFAPTYEKLALENKHLESSRGIFLGQINCQIQGDLCNSHEIKFYPQIKLYRSSQEVAQYTGDRSYSHLTQYIDEESTVFARGLSQSKENIVHSKGHVMDGATATASAHSQVSAPSGPNVSGQSANLDQNSFERLLEEGPAFIKFYAPWCGHCKKLAPTWSDLATAMQNKLNIAEVNCEALPDLCNKHNIKGYPTLLLYQAGIAKPYNGARKLDKMTEFASSALMAIEFTHIEANHLPHIRKENEVYFLYLQTFSSKTNDLTTVKQTGQFQIGAAAFFESSDPAIFTSTGIEPTRGSVLAAFKGNSTKPVGAFYFDSSDSRDKQSVEHFILRHKYSFVTKLTSDNQDEMFTSPTRPLIVLAAMKVSGRNDNELKVDLKKYETIARAWVKGGRPFVQPVHFVWVDADKQRKWLKSTYGMNLKKLPAVVVIDPPLNEYYDTTLEREATAFDGASIFSTLEGLYQHFLVPKAGGSALERGSKQFEAGLMGIMMAIGHHPFWAFFISACIVAFLIFGLGRVVEHDLTKNGNARLD